MALAAHWSTAARLYRPGSGGLSRTGGAKMVKVVDWSKTKGQGNKSDPHAGHTHEFDEVDFTLENSCDSYDEDLDDELQGIEERYLKKTQCEQRAETCLDVEMR